MVSSHTPLSRRALISAASLSALAAATVSTPAQAAVTVKGGIGSWYNNVPGVKSRLGLPIENEQLALSGKKHAYYQKFQRGIILWNDQTGAKDYQLGTYAKDSLGRLRRTDQVLTSNHALVISDSQGNLDGSLIGNYGPMMPAGGEGYSLNQIGYSWINLGLQAAGWKVVQLGHGARGAMQPYIDSKSGKAGVDQNTVLKGGVSFARGIIDAAYPMPLGEPGLIWLTMSYNDNSWNNRNNGTVPYWYDQTVKALKELYPNSTIMLSEMLSRVDPHHAPRIALTESIEAGLQDRGQLILQNRYWGTEHVSDRSTMYKDDVHLSPRGHEAVAPHVTAWLRNQNLTRQESSLTYASVQRYEVRGGIKTYYDANGAAARFGEPIQNERLSVDGGYLQNFSNRWAIYWTPQFGSHSIRWGTAIGGVYEQNQWELGMLGYPTSDEYVYRDGAMQHFWKKGTGKHYTVAWTPYTGAFIMVRDGGIEGRFKSNPEIGFPVTNEYKISGGYVQYFRNSRGAESAVYWSAYTGAKIMNSRGAIYSYYRSHGYLSTFGYPTTDETWTGSYYYVRFSKGYEIRWSATRGSWTVRI